MDSQWPQSFLTFLKPSTGSHTVNLSPLLPTGSLLAWFRSYLSNRSQRVVLDGHSSTIHAVTSGVPQGSILGPLLFSIYLNPLTNISLSRDSTLILYADDIVLYRPIATHSDVESLQADVDKVSKWVRDAGIFFECPKVKSDCVFLQACSPSCQYSCLPQCHSSCCIYCFLGVTISCELKWSTHVINTCAKARQQLALLYRLFGMADPATLAHLYKCLVLPTLDYCSVVQRLAARLTTKRWSTSPDNPLYSLNWTTLQARRKKQKIMYGLCSYIKWLFHHSPHTLFSPPSS